MVAEESDGSMQWFHFFDGILLGQRYPEGFHAKSMVSKRFTLVENNSLLIPVRHDQFRRDHGADRTTEAK